MIGVQSELHKVGPLPRWLPVAVVASGVGVTLALLASLTEPHLAARLVGTNASTIASILRQLGNLPWWADLLLLAVGGAGVIFGIVRRYGLKYAASW